MAKLGMMKLANKKKWNPPKKAASKPRKKVSKAKKPLKKKPAAKCKKKTPAQKEAKREEERLALQRMGIYMPKAALAHMRPGGRPWVAHPKNPR
jgi:hypothetical protein